MARPRKPVGAQNGHLKVEYRKGRELAEGEMSQTGNALLSERPGWLINKDAAEMWDILTAYLTKHSFYGDIDVANVAGYCNAYARYKAAWRELKKTGPDVLEVDGKFVENPYVGEIKKWSEEMTRCQNRGGFSVNARIGIGEKAVQKQEEELKETFGI